MKVKIPAEIIEVPEGDYCDDCQQLFMKDDHEWPSCRQGFGEWEGVSLATGYDALNNRDNWGTLKPEECKNLKIIDKETFLDEQIYEKIFELALEDIDGIREGYRSDYEITENDYIIATLDHDGGPSLITLPKHKLHIKIDNFFKKYKIKTINEFKEIIYKTDDDFFIDLIYGV